MEAISPGADLIKAERIRQIEKHKFDVDNDKQHNTNELLSVAAWLLTGDAIYYPHWWPIEKRERIANHTEQEKRVIAGALIAAQLDLDLYNAELGR